MRVRECITEIHAEASELRLGAYWIILYYEIESATSIELGPLPTLWMGKWAAINDLMEIFTVPPVSVHIHPEIINTYPYPPEFRE